MGSTEGFGQFPGLSLYSEWLNDQINTFFFHWKINTIILLFFLQVGSKRSKPCALVFLSFLFCFIFPSSRIALGSCLPSGMVAPILTACMRNDKMGEASVLQNQTTVCNCPPLSSGFPSYFLSFFRSVLLFSPSWNLCGVASTHPCPCSTPYIQIHPPKIHCQCRRCRNRCYGYFMQMYAPVTFNLWLSCLEVKECEFVLVN